jgi:rare lipoprotein A
VALLAACGSTPKKGGFYQDDGPPREAPAHLSKTPDAVPRVEPFHRYANRPYTALGRRYVPMTEDRPFRARGMASWYGRQFHGSRTSSGEIYDMFAMTAAHPTLPLPSYARVTHLKSGASVIVRVNDRGPFKHDRVIDLSYAAAMKLGIASLGTAEVEIVRLTFDDIRSAHGSGAVEPVALPAAATAVAPAPAVASHAAAVVPAPAAATAAPSAPVTSLAPTVAPGPAAAPAMPAVPLPAVGGPWSVQLGAFEIAGNAETLRERVAAMIEQAGQYDIAVHAPRVEQDGSTFRVLVGHLPDRESAQSLAERLERLLGRSVALYVR